MSLHPADHALAYLIDGSADDSASSAARAHLARCDACRTRLERLRALGAALARIPAPAADTRFGVEVMARIERRKRPSWRPLGMGALIGAAATALVAVAVVDPGGPAELGTFTPRGGDDASDAPVAVAAFVQSDPTAPRIPLARDAELAPGFVMTFRATRRQAIGDDAATWLMLLACDAAGEIHWALPAWQDPATDPIGARLAPDQPIFEAPNALAPDAPPGAMSFIALTTSEPIGVRRVESLLTRCADTSALAALPGARITRVPFSIRSR